MSDYENSEPEDEIDFLSDYSSNSSFSNETDRNQNNFFNEVNGDSDIEMDNDDHENINIEMDNDHNEDYENVSVSLIKN